MSNNENKITKVAELNGTQKMQATIVNEVKTTIEAVGGEITPYGSKCAVNAISGAIAFLRAKDKTLKDVNATLFKLSVQSVALLELNYNSVPAEIYFDLRGDILTIKPQGAGNEKLIRRYGVGIKPNTGLHNAWLIREGDEFTYPSYNGLEIVPPTWTPKSYSNKVIMVVYPIEKIDGSVDYLIADRESVKPNIVAQIRQNTLYAFKSNQGVDFKKRDEFYEQLNKDAESMSVDELVNCEKYDKYINPTYTSVGSKEAMIIRKMKNNALKSFPREFDNSYMKDAVETLYEDNDDSLKKKYVGEVDITEKVNKEVDKKPEVENAPKDFEVNEDGEILDAEVKAEPKKETKPEPQPKVEPKVEKEAEPKDEFDDF